MIDSKANVSIISLTDGRQVLQSYGVTVAAFIPYRGFVRTRERFSVATSRHVSQYTNGTKDLVPEIDHAELLKLTKPIESKK